MMIGYGGFSQGLQAGVGLGTSILEAQRARRQQDFLEQKEAADQQLRAKELADQQAYRDRALGLDEQRLGLLGRQTDAEINRNNALTDIARNMYPTEKALKEAEVNRTNALTDISREMYPTEKALKEAETEQQQLQNAALKDRAQREAAQRLQQQKMRDAVVNFVDGKFENMSDEDVHHAAALFHATVSPDIIEGARAIAQAGQYQDPKAKADYLNSPETLQRVGPLLEKMTNDWSVGTQYPASTKNPHFQGLTILKKQVVSAGADPNTNTFSPTVRVTLGAPENDPEAVDQVKTHAAQLLSADYEARRKRPDKASSFTPQQQDQLAELARTGRVTYDAPMTLDRGPDSEPMAIPYERVASQLRGLAAVNSPNSNAFVEMARQLVPVYTDPKEYITQLVQAKKEADNLGWENTEKISKAIMAEMTNRNSAIAQGVSDEYATPRNLQAVQQRNAQIGALAMRYALGGMSVPEAISRSTQELTPDPSWYEALRNAK